MSCISRGVCMGTAVILTSLQLLEPRQIYITSSIIGKRPISQGSFRRAVSRKSITCCGHLFRRCAKLRDDADSFILRQSSTINYWKISLFRTAARHWHITCPLERCQLVASYLQYGKMCSAVFLGYPASRSLAKTEVLLF